MDDYTYNKERIRRSYQELGNSLVVEADTDHKYLAAQQMTKELGVNPAIRRVAFYQNRPYALDVARERLQDCPSFYEGDEGLGGIFDGFMYCLAKRPNGLCRVSLILEWVE